MNVLIKKPSNRCPKNETGKYKKLNDLLKDLNRPGCHSASFHPKFMGSSRFSRIDRITLHRACFKLNL